MNPKIRRRNFLKTGYKACIACSAILYSSRLDGMSSFFIPEEKPDPKKLNYCGYVCTQDCKFLKATRANNAVMKEEVFKEWKIKEKYGVEFDADKIFCWGCKTMDKPLGIIIEKCEVRKCVISKNYECCIECKDLTGCKKELWDQFPDFKRMVIKMQQKYLASDTTKNN